MQVCIFSFETPQSPTISMALVYARLGFKVHFVALFCPPQIRSCLQENAVAVTSVLSAPFNTRLPVAYRAVAKLLRPTARSFQNLVLPKIAPFKKDVWSILSSELANSSMLVVATAYSALFLGEKLLHERYVINVLELYENERYALGRYLRAAETVVDVEISRAAITKVLFHLKKLPFVVPNKADFHPRCRERYIRHDVIRAKLEQCRDKKIVLYQGGIGRDRPLRELAIAMHELRDEWAFVIMGDGDKDYLARLTDLCPNLVYVGFVEPPDHLDVTSHADVGVLQYAANSLNNVFCAPNKIWEYAGFGIPVLAPKLPSLQYYYDRFKAAEYCDFDDHEDILQKLKDVSKRYESYKAQATALYESVDVPSVYLEIAKPWRQ